ncbi:MAG: hypothetical protein P8Y10_06875 [Gemmatimonadales bacterium]|jgi:hypothetical protein
MKRETTKAAGRRRNRGMGVRLRVGLVAAVVAIAVLQAGCASSLKIRDLLEDPGRYNGQTVQVHGVVTRGGPIMSGAYELSDNTGTIMVILSERGAPRDGTSLKVQGTFRSGYDYDNSRIAVILKDR